MTLLLSGRVPDCVETVRDRLAHPVSAADTPRSPALGCVLAPTVVVPLGYAIAVVRSSIRGDPVPPDMELDEDLARDGAVALGITVCYALPAILMASLATGPVRTVGVVVLGIAGAYAAPGALVRFASEGLREGVAPTDVLDVVLTGPYLRTWIVSASPATVAVAITWLVAVAVSPWIALPVGAVLGFYAVTLVAREHAITYDSLLESGPDREDGATGVPV